MALQKIKITKIFDKGTIFILALCLAFGGVLMCNSNTEYPPVPAPVAPDIDKYRIVQDNGECWVVTSNEKGVTGSLMRGDNLDECVKYLNNLIQLGVTDN